MKLTDFIKYPSLGALFRRRRNNEVLTPDKNHELIDLGHKLDVEFHTDQCRFVKGEYNTTVTRNGEDVLVYVEVGDTVSISRFALRMTFGKSPEEAESEMVQYLTKHTVSLVTERETFRFPPHDSVEELHMRLSVMGTASWSARK